MMSPAARVNPRGRRVRGPAGPDGPWVLGLETGGDELSAALWRLPTEVGRPVSAWRLAEEVTTQRGHKHADSVLLLVDQLLWRQGLAPKDLALIAAGRGPGGFTGVRVGLSTALGLSLGLGVPVWTVPSLDALAQHAAGRDGLVVPLIDARRGEVFGAAYRVPAYGELELVLAPRAATCDSVLSAVREAAREGESVTFLGSGAVVHGVASDVPPTWHRGAATHVAALAGLAWDAHRRDGAMAPPVDPAYLRASDAEIDADRKAAAESGPESESGSEGANHGE
ncbi:MAG: tRNA (adenosine(37)-N6)-threonylcarbamoyltransferase complex dimerization subunit type 1 TsaB [Deltaproteobacteria bacterium]|nr:tRNA (adenosine(37)-N6)-threonylcarbamoyltransferase complex dimerization subunit type 1 TsaB [Deltaproteobacteria bacterium]